MERNSKRLDYRIKGKRIKVLTFSVLIIIVLLSTMPKQTMIVKAQETSSHYECGPYQAGWIDVYNISSIRGKYLPLTIYYPAIEEAENSDPNNLDAPYPTVLITPGIGVNYFGYTNLAEMLSSWGYCAVLVGSDRNSLPNERSDDQIETLDWLDKNNDNSAFSQQGAAEYYWSLFIRPLQQ